MSTLKEAWDAIRQGDRPKAQKIAAHILKNDPRNAEGWMVLGESVSGERQALFYRKALQLEPDLEVAKQRLLEIEQNQQLGISTEAPTAHSLPIMTGEPEVPEGVSLDAPTLPLEERIAAEKATPKTQSTAAMEARAKTMANTPTSLDAEETAAQVSSGSGFDPYTILLLIIVISILVVLYLMYQNLPSLT